MSSVYPHTSVLLPEIITALQPRPGGQYIDATLGLGGHAEKILESSNPSGTLLGIDADPTALQAASTRLERFGPRVTLVESYFDRLLPVAQEAGFSTANGVLFDLGVSSPQLDQAERGFSFQASGPLDMRMGPSATTHAGQIINSWPVSELQRIFFEYGEERYARRIARRIDEERRTAPIETTGRLAEIVSRAKPHHHGERIHPATRVFQALRIAVNEELERLRVALPQAVASLRPGGRLAVISFHSLEDRIVKQFMRTEARGCVCPPELPVCVCGRQPTVRLLTPRPITASPVEVASNPRARSARLRVAERIASEAIITHQGERS